MSNKNESLVSALHKLFDFFRIEPELTISQLPNRAFNGRLNSLGSQRPRYIPPKGYDLQFNFPDLKLGIEGEARGLGCAIFVIAHAFLSQNIQLKELTVVHKDMEALMKAAEEDTELFGKFEFGHRNFKEISLQHAHNEDMQGFKIRLAGIDDPKQMLLEIISIFRKQVPSLKFLSNKKVLEHTAVITIPINKDHQIEIYLEKKT